MFERLRQRIATFPGALTLVTLFGAALRAFTSPWQIYHPDSGLYLLLAQRISHGRLDVPMGGETGYYQPLFSAITALFGAIGGNLEIAGCLVSVLAGGGVIVLTGMLAKRLFGTTAGITAALIVAAHPQTAHFSGVALTESLYTVCLIAGVLVSWIALRDDGARRWFFAGLIMGLAYLARVAGFFEAIVPAAWALATVKPRRLGIKATAAFLIGAALLIGPYVGYLRAEQGAWRLTGQQGLAYKNVVKRADRHLIDGKVDPNTGRLAGRQTADRVGTFELLRHWPHLLRHAVAGLDDIYRDLGTVFPPLFAIAMGLGLAGLLFNGDSQSSRGVVFLFSWWIPAICLQALTGTSPRYYVPLAPLGAAMAGLGCSYVFARANRKWGIIVTLALAASLLATVRFGPDPDAEWVRLQRLTGDWIARHAKGRYVKVMTREPYVAYFAGGERIIVPDEPLVKTLEYARRWKAEYIVVDSMLIGLQPQLAPLLDPSNSPPGWRPVYMATEERRVIHVYQRKEPDAGISGHTPVQ